MKLTRSIPTQPISQEFCEEGGREVCVLSTLNFLEEVGNKNIVDITSCKQKTLGVEGRDEHITNFSHSDIGCNS